MPLNHITPTIVDLYRLVSWDVNGQPSYSAGSRVRARVEWVDEEIKNQAAQMVRVKARAWLFPDVDVADNDRAVIAGDVYRVAKVERPRDVTGRADHHEVALAEENE